VVLAAAAEEVFFSPKERVWPHEARRIAGMKSCLILSF
jgi:hypothetical protein